MQSFNNTTKSNVHVKVEYNQEYRRFQVETLSFEHLQNTLRTLLNIDPAQLVKILFLDDEKDWVLLTSDSELAHAWELSPTLLRLSVKLIASPALVSIPHQPVVPASATGCEVVPFAPHPFMRGGPCRGRGGRGGKGRCDPSARIQFFENKIVRLTEKRDALKVKVAGMPEDRARAVSWRISHLENKIENIKWKKEHFAKLGQMVEEPNETAATCCNEEFANTTETTPAPTECPYGFKGGRGRGGCHGRWGGQGNRWGEGEACPRQRACENPLFVAIQERKAELKAARKGGDQEEIQAKWEAVQEAKETWKQAKRAQWAAKKQAK